MEANNLKSLGELSRAESKVFYGLFIASFIVFLVIALVAQILGLKWRDWFPGAQGQKSLLEGVRVAVNSYLPCVFME